MDIEFGPSKSARNRHKHGIDFATARWIFQDPDLLVVPARTVDEERWIGIGSLGGHVWTAVFTLRAESIRVISVGRARASEVQLYEGA